jgi:hypothetical protein
MLARVRVGLSRIRGRAVSGGPLGSPGAGGTARGGVYRPRAQYSQVSCAFRQLLSYAGQCTFEKAPASPFGEFTFYLTADVETNDDPSSRRLSLPHIYDDLPSLLVLNGLHWQDKMQNLNYPVHLVANTNPGVNKPRSQSRRYTQPLPYYAAWSRGFVSSVDTTRHPWHYTV